MGHKRENYRSSLCGKSYIREKKIRCGDKYMAVGVYAVTDQEHRKRGKKRKESDKGQKNRNKAASMRKKQRKVLANFDKRGFFLTGTYEDATCRMTRMPAGRTWRTTRGG